MTLQTPYVPEVKNPDGVSHAYNFGFKAAKPEHVKAGIQDPATGVITAGVFGVDYTVALGAPLPAAGSVTWTTGGDVVGKKVVLWRSSAPIEQLSSFDPAKAFSSGGPEAAFDLLTLMMQEMSARIDRTYRIPDGDAQETTPAGPDKVTRANKVFVWDASGNHAVSALTIAQIEAGTVDAAASAAAAAGSASAAATSETNAATSEANAAASAAAAAAAAGSVKVSANDTTPGNLEAKILGSGLVGLATQNDGGDETRTIDVPKASQAEAEAGVVDTKAMTPMRVAQAIAALGAGFVSASQAEVEAVTENAKGITPLNAKWLPGYEKAGCRFDGTGTPSVTAGHNVSSITDNGVGDYTVNLGITFSATTWRCQATTSLNTSSNFDRIATPFSFATGSVRLRTSSGGATAEDHALISIACFGDL